MLAKLTALAIARAVRLCEALLTLTACMLLVTGCRMKVFTFILLPVMQLTLVHGVRKRPCTRANKVGEW